MQIPGEGYLLGGVQFCPQFYLQGFNIVSMKCMIMIGYCLDTAGKIQIILVLEHTTVSIQVKTRMGVTL